MSEISLTRRVLEAYSKVHPSTIPYVKWQISRENCEIIAKENEIDDLLNDLVAAGELRMLGIPVQFTESNEVLLVVVA